MPDKEGAQEKSTTKEVVNKKQKQMMGEEGYDVARDEGRVKPSKDKKDATSYPVSDEVRKTQKKNEGPSALEIVKKKYGKAVMDMKKEELDLTKVAESFGGYIVEIETHDKKSFSQFRGELNEINERPGLGSKIGGFVLSKTLDLAKKARDLVVGTGRTISKRFGNNRKINPSSVRRNRRKIDKKFSNNKSTVNPKDFNPLEYIKKTTEKIKPEIIKRGKQIKKTVQTAGDKAKENPVTTTATVGGTVAAGETARRVIGRGTKGKTTTRPQLNKKTNKRNRRTPGVGVPGGGRFPRIGFKLPQTSHNVGRVSNPQ